MDVFAQGLLSVNGGLGGVLNPGGVEFGLVAVAPLTLAVTSSLPTLPLPELSPVNQIWLVRMSPYWPSVAAVNGLPTLITPSATSSVQLPPSAAAPTRPLEAATWAPPVAIDICTSNSAPEKPSPTLQP